MQIEDADQLLEVVVGDEHGRRVGHVVGVHFAPNDAFCAVWLVLRIRGWRRRLRAAPAHEARWHVTGRLDVAVTLDIVFALPAVPRRHLDARSREAVTDFYTRAGVALTALNTITDQEKEER